MDFSRDVSVNKDTLRKLPIFSEMKYKHKYFLGFPTKTRDLWNDRPMRCLPCLRSLFYNKKVECRKSDFHSFSNLIEYIVQSSMMIYDNLLQI